MHYLNAIRIHHWVKNLLIFIPILASHKINSENLALTCFMFVSFSLIASAGYIFNDLIDLKSDRNHPSKKFRPIARGIISKQKASFIALMILILGFYISFKINLNFFILLIFYLITSVSYSIYFKKKIIIDILILSILYTYRIYASSITLEIYLSVWLLAFSIFIFFSLASIKRLTEILKLNNLKSQRNRGYKKEDSLIINIAALCSGYLSVLILALYINSNEVRDLYSHPYILFGSCVIMVFWITRMLIITNRKQMNYDPVVFASKDLTSYISLTLIIFFAFLSI
jgi:4-hydroxybenzoate polyprenyltransferase